jgi:WD40 repeat protein
MSRLNDLLREGWLMTKAWLLLLGLLCPVACAAELEWSASRAHERWINTVAFSLDGKWIATGSDDQTIKVWDVACGKLLWRQPATTAITAIAWSADSKQLIIGSWRGGLQVHDAKDGKLQVQWQAHRENITGLAISSDGLKLATASGDDTCKVWDLATRRCLLTIEQDNEYDATCVAFSPDQQFVVVGDGENLVKMYRVRDGELLLTFTGHAETIAAVAFGPDGKHVISGSADDSIRLWNAATGAELRVLRGHTDDLTSLALSGDGNRLVTGSADRSAVVWEISTGKQLELHSDFPHGVTAVAISRDGTRVAIGSRQELRIKEVAK